MHHEYVNISFAHGWIHLWRIWKLLLLYQIKEYSVDWKGPLRDWTLTLRPLSWTLCNEQGYLQQDTKLFFPSISILIYLLLKYACTVNILLTTCMNSEHPCVGFTHNKMHFFLCLEDKNCNVWMPPVLPPPSLHFYIRADAVWYGIPIWLIWISWPSCVPSLSGSAFGWRGEVAGHCCCVSPGQWDPKHRWVISTSQPPA